MSMLIQPRTAQEAGMLEEISQMAHKQPNLNETNPGLANSLQSSVETKVQESRLGRAFTLDAATFGSLRAGSGNNVDLTANRFKRLASSNLRSFKDALALQGAAAELVADVDVASSVISVWAKAQQTASDRISPIR